MNHQRIPALTCALVLIGGVAAAQIRQSTPARSPASTPTRAPVAERAPAPNSAPAAIRHGAPRETIAITKADAVGSYVAAYGGFDVGGGVAAMFATALTNSNRFIVVERADLADVLTEQELAQAGLTTAESGARTGGLLGARYLVSIAISEFSVADRGGGLSLGFSFGKVPVSGTITPQSSEGEIALDVRVIDSETAEIATAFQVRERIEQKSLGLSVNFRQVSAATNNFDNTPLGQVTRRLADRAVGQLVGIVDLRPWRGQIVECQGNEIILNAGSNSGLVVGDRFVIERTTKVLTDPATGRRLGARQQRLGDAVVTRVEAELAYASFSAAGPMTPVRGDAVISR